MSCAALRSQQRSSLKSWLSLLTRLYAVQYITSHYNFVYLTQLIHHKAGSERMPNRGLSSVALAMCFYKPLLRPPTTRLPSEL